MLHKYPFNKEFYVNISGIASKLDDVTDVSKVTSKIQTPTLKRASGLEDIAVPIKRPSYVELPVGSQRRITAGAEFDLRNRPIKTTDISVPRTGIRTTEVTPPPRYVTPEKLDWMKEVRTTAEKIGYDKMADNLTRQIDDIELNINTGKIKTSGDIPEISPELTTLKQKVKQLEENITDVKKGMTVDESVETDRVLNKLNDEIKTKRTPEEQWESAKNITKDMYAELKKPGTLKAAGILAAVITVAALQIKSRTDADRINGTDYRITSIMSSEMGVTILYEPKDTFTLNDNVTLFDTNSTPKIDGDYGLLSRGNGKIVIKGPEIKIRGDSGKLKCFTTVGDQLSQNVADTVRPITQTVAETTGGILGGTASALYESIIPKGLRETISKTWIISLIFCLLISCSGVLVFIMSLAK